MDEYELKKFCLIIYLLNISLPNVLRKMPFFGQVWRIGYMTKENIMEYKK